MNVNEYLPQRVNTSSFVCWHTLNHLQTHAADAHFVLPICSIGTAAQHLRELGDLVLPPLYREALTDDLKAKIVAQVRRCFPELRADSSRDSDRVRVVELSHEPTPCSTPAEIVAFSVDTAVEEHGPHLPLATDTVQSYGVLQRLSELNPGLVLAPPLDYGQLTWGLPFGFSVDLTAELLTDYVSRYATALRKWANCESLYVVDVHGSIVHRTAIVTGLRQSADERWTFRWLHEPLIEFASERGDQHAGAVETALVEYLNRDLLDDEWWPGRIDELRAGQMSFEKAVELTPDLAQFSRHVQAASANGIVGRIENYSGLDAEVMFKRMLTVAQQDLEELRGGATAIRTNPGIQAW